MDASSACIFCTRSFGGLTPLVSFVPLGFPGGTSHEVCTICGGALLLARQIADDLGMALPECLHLLAGDVEQVLGLEPVGSAARRVRAIVVSRIGDYGTRRLRALCNCSTCTALREPDGWRSLGYAASAVVSEVQDVRPSERPPVDAEGASNLLLRSLNEAQPVRLPDGSIVSAAAAVLRRLQDNHAATARPPMGPLLAPIFAQVLARGPDRTPRPVRDQDDGFRKAYWTDVRLLGVDAARLNDVKRRFSAAMWDEFFMPSDGHYALDGSSLWWVENETGEAFDISDVLHMSDVLPGRV